MMAGELAPSFVAGLAGSLVGAGVVGVWISLKLRELTTLKERVEKQMEERLAATERAVTAQQTCCAARASRLDAVERVMVGVNPGLIEDRDKWQVARMNQMEAKLDKLIEAVTRLEEQSRDRKEHVQAVSAKADRLHAELDRRVSNLEAKTHGN